MGGVGKLYYTLRISSKLEVLFSQLLISDQGESECRSELILEQRATCYERHTYTGICIVSKYNILYHGYLRLTISYLS